ncbi:hypothetical protein [uncultured Nitrospira sp.]|uniref:hypothetical protein n=1 Tax=uncultured Nitrospira sp. TaxID=157176 RepID=UPI0031407C42
MVVFSSREQAGPEKIGQATMMTLMSGTVIEKSAMAEGTIPILKLSDFTVGFWTSGIGTKTLEQLNVPIVSNRPLDARDILRAQAGQHALDRALERLGSACQSEKKARLGFTDNFRIADRVRSPALSDAS